MVAIQKLKSGDIAIYVNSSKTKRDLEAETNWVTSIAPGATVHKRTWPVLVYRVRVANYPVTA